LLLGSLELGLFLQLFDGLEVALKVALL